MDTDRVERDLPGDTRQVTEAVRESAEIWGATWDLDHQTGSSARGRLTLPVRAGLRHGSLTGPVTVEGTGTRTTRLAFHPEDAEYHLWTPAVVVLLLAVGGSALVTLWPFFPELLPTAPLGAIMALSGWLLVVTRLKHQGTSEFLELIGEIVADEAGNDPPPPGVVPDV
jgi:hypothetical protein